MVLPEAVHGGPSSTEAQYKALADVSAKVTWLVSLLRGIGLSSISQPKLWCDELRSYLLVW